MPVLEAGVAEVLAREQPVAVGVERGPQLGHLEAVEIGNLGWPVGRLPERGVLRDGVAGRAQTA